MRNENPEQDDLYQALIALSDHFASHEGRRPRMTIASLGQGLKAESIKTSNEFADLGFDVDIAPSLDEVQRLWQQVIDNDAHILLVLMCHADLEKYLDDLIEVTKEQHPEEVLFVVKSADELDCGTVETIKDSGIFFGPEASVFDMAKYMFEAILDQR